MFFYFGLFSCQQAEIPRNVLRSADLVTLESTIKKNSMALFRSTFQRRCVLFAVVFLAAAISKAAVVQYYGHGPSSPGTEAQFLTLTGQTPNNFNSLSGGNKDEADLYGTAPFTYTIFGVSALDSPDYDNDAYVVTVAGHGQAVSTFAPNTFLRVTFSANYVTAVGGDFFSTDEDGLQFEDTMTVRITFFDNTFVDQTYSSPSAGEFQGFITDTPIKWLTIGVTGDALFPTMDDIVAVPEPVSTGIAAALVCLLVAGRGILMRVYSKLRAQAP